jgi:hypothetical protein
MTAMLIRGKSLAVVWTPVRRSREQQKVSKNIFQHSSYQRLREHRKFTQSGVDVMITIFCDYRQFSAEKMSFFSKTDVMIKILNN